VSTRTSRGIFVVGVGIIWIALALLMPLSRTVTAGLAGFALIAAVLASLLFGQSPSESRPGGHGKWWRGLNYRNKVNAIAAVAALLAFAGTSVALLEQPVPDKSSGKVPGETTRTTADTNEESEGKQDKSNKKVHTQVTEEKEPVDKADESLLGRAVDNTAGVVLVRLGLALLAGFIVGLVVQRVMLGKYAITLPFGLGSVPDVTEAQTATVTQNAKKDPALNKTLQESKRQGPEKDLARIEDRRMKIIASAGKTESELRDMAKELPAVNEDAPIGQVIEGVVKETDLGPNGGAAIQEFIDIGTQVAAGAELEPGVEQWVDEVGQHLPGAIKAL